MRLRRARRGSSRLEATARRMMLLGDSWAGYDAWKTEPPDWVMPYHTRRCADETRWRMHRDPRRHPFFDCDESEYEYLCEEWDQLARIDAHERGPEDEDFEEMPA
ncbi:hypothetical protein [Mesorhizobium sp. M4A.F.Ca.ET.090.04.2.1]|uniref:hypothetical protein n=1 Tax=Mesorhizobium sp. M4A.F.Ca.ET.090.04.2.1 TaxID=2496663 RepID=UPI001AEC9BAB|nr:hypothetical protein [Mesorhizobium sp. M4A.F.Ca.ET.090.04.2.1]